jgi:hypothetical protein
MIHTTNDVMHSLLFQASLLVRYCAESLHAATYLLKLLPTKMISAPSPHFALFSTPPFYAHLRVFGYACYANLCHRSLHAPINVSFSTIHLRIRATDALIFP